MAMARTEIEQFPRHTHTHIHTYTRKRRLICEETENRIQQAKRTEEEKQAVQRGREHMCSMMCSARAECRRGDGERRGERDKKTEKITAAKIQFSNRKWSSHSGQEKEIWRSQRPRGGETEQFKRKDKLYPKKST